MDSDVITPQGYAELKQELDKLWREERPAVTKIVQWAASLGDRSENADYKYNKGRLREIDRRVRFLRQRLEKLRVVEYNPIQEGKAFFGAWVTLLDEADRTLTFRIVGPDEIYGKKDFASVNAPVARACIGKSVGDDVVVSTSDGNKEWQIQSIDYNRE
ncbi:transcription elongation factor GreB [Granulosicoccus antarcticus]|uniref:Transcription elongation factor GreB n=1 Tax=Granulosicoccus antarcticus IMCC3135 TaxID=1192854 RepID=A0A2Z2NN46_9GAMM|nr:transcription elongation factor GreB [Granulosicoccus antarcticus]ASJ72882.1 Transcription elongation factor GreB [Granulosicoccus antarcticus IMCC3135]